NRTRSRGAQDEPVLVHPGLHAEMCQNTGRAHSLYPAGISNAREHRGARITWRGNEIAGPVLCVGAATDANTAHRGECLADDDAVAVMTDGLTQLDLLDRRWSAEHRFRRSDERGEARRNGD